MKYDERAFLLILYSAGHILGTPARKRVDDVRTLALRCFAGRLKRARCILSKWTKKGWYDYGVALDLGWLTELGAAEAEKIKATLTPGPTLDDLGDVDPKRRPEDVKKVLRWIYERDLAEGTLGQPLKDRPPAFFEWLMQEGFGVTEAPERALFEVEGRYISDPRGLTWTPASACSGDGSVFSGLCANTTTP